MSEAGQIRIGCSGWAYKHWRGLFYPDKLPSSRWFGHYAGIFGTVELNTSFYHLPKPETFDKWREQAPAGFSYAVKAPRFITHMKKLKDCAEPVEVFIERARKLGPNLGPILYQLPPRFAFDRARVEAFLPLLPRDLDHVIEIRETSWISREVLDMLDAGGIGFCVHDMAGSATPFWASGPIAYLRFHGGEGKYWGRYTDDRLRTAGTWMLEQARAGRDVWAYFNNDIHGHAIDDALALRAIIAEPSGSAL